MIGKEGKGGIPQKILNNARIRSELLLVDAESQGEQLCGHRQLMKMSLRKVTRL